MVCALCCGIAVAAIAVIAGLRCAESIKGVLPVLRLTFSFGLDRGARARAARLVSHRFVHGQKSTSGYSGLLLQGGSLISESIHMVPHVGREGQGDGLQNSGYTIFGIISYYHYKESS